MNFTSFAAAGLAFVLSANIVGAEQYDAPLDADTESLDAPMPDQAPESSAPASSTTGAEHKASLPYTPYPAGLAWVMTPQSFYAPFRHTGLYYPPHTYVRRCPYYPRGYYWGANWRFNVIGRGNLLLLGTRRFNPYLTTAKSEHHRHTRGQKRYAPPPGPIGQAELLGSSGPGAPVALPPTAAPEDVGGDADSGYHAKAAAPARSATVRLAAPRTSAQTASTRQRSKSAASRTKSGTRR